MENPDYLTIARVLHVAGVVVWIGGVAFVTTVLIPSLRGLVDPDERLELFETLEGRFARQARVVTVITGLSGFYMLHGLDAWGLYLDLRFWWVHMMTFVWFVFTLVLFVLEPLFLHRWFHEQAIKDPTTAFGVLHAMHKILLGLSLVAIVGAVTGVRGFQWS